MDGLELFLEHISNMKTGYDELDVNGMSSYENLFRKLAMADSIIHNQEIVIKKLLELKQ